jgi:putative NADH-flavin reductase
MSPSKRPRPSAKSKTMRVLVFGASGGTGRELVSQALAQGHQVTAFARDPAKLDINHANLRVAQGNVADYATVERAVKNQDAVICALGASTPLRRDPILVQGVHSIIDAMERTGGRRLIYLSFLGVRNGRSQLSLLGKIVAPLALHNVVADHEAKERLIRQSHLKWTIVRAPKLTNGRRTGTYRSGDDIGANFMVPTISRADVAEFMLKQVTDDTYLRKAPAVMY